MQSLSLSPFYIWKKINYKNEVQPFFLSLIFDLVLLINSPKMAPTTDESEPVRIELPEVGRIRSFSSSFRQQNSSFRSSSTMAVEKEDKRDTIDASLWAAVERLPTFERLRSSLFDDIRGVEVEENDRRRVVDVTKLEDVERHLFIQKLIKHIENDNLKLFTKIKERIHK